MKNLRLLFFIILLLCGSPVFSQGKIYAVLIGVSEYANPANNLTYCHQDAIDMYDLLKEHTSAERMALLTNRQATHSNIVYYTQKLFQQAQPEDIVIFFFSGHGGDNIFATHDKYLDFSTLQKIFKSSKAKRKLIFADACYSGTLRQSGNQSISQNTNMGKNVLLFLSSRSNQMSTETGSLRNGVFTYFLLAGLKGGADVNKDEYITAKELFVFVYPKVKERSNGSQIPVMWGKFDENMVILKKKKK